MAMADYYLCDVCNGKAQYDSNIAWAEGISITILCSECAKTHDVMVVPKSSPVPDSSLDELLDELDRAAFEQGEEGVQAVDSAKSSIRAYVSGVRRQEREKCAKIVRECKNDTSYTVPGAVVDTRLEWAAQAIERADG